MIGLSVTVIYIYINTHIYIAFLKIYLALGKCLPPFLFVFEELVLCYGPLPSLSSSESFQKCGSECIILLASSPHLPPPLGTLVLSGRKPLLWNKSSLASNAYQNVLAELAALIKQPAGAGAVTVPSEGGQVMSRPPAPLHCATLKGGRQKASKNIWSLQIWKEKLFFYVRIQISKRISLQALVRGCHPPHILCPWTKLNWSQICISLWWLHHGLF